MERRRKEMFLFSEALNTFYLRLYGLRHMVNDHSDSDYQQGFFYMHHPTDRITHSSLQSCVPKTTYTNLGYASSHRQDGIYIGLCYTSHGALVGMRNSSMGPPRRIDPTTHCTLSERSYHGSTSRSHRGGGGFHSC